MHRPSTAGKGAKPGGGARTGTKATAAPSAALSAAMSEKDDYIVRGASSPSSLKRLCARLTPYRPFCLVSTARAR